MLRAAATKDLPVIAALLNRAYHRPDAGWSTQAAYLEGDRTTPALLRSALTDCAGAQLLRWDQDGGLAGCVWLEPLGRGAWYLGSLAVEPARQRDGIGRRLLAAAEARARDQGGTTMQITVINVRGAMRAWYARRGYRETGAIEPFPYGDARFGRPLRNDLAFVVLEKRLPS